MSKTVMDLVLEQLKDLNSKLDDLVRNGCSHAADHTSNQSYISERVRRLETAAAEGRGRLIVINIITGAAIAAFFQWVGRHF